MPPSSPIILITGANRGIGLAILHSLAAALPSSTLLLGCRDAVKGEAAISELRSQGIDATIIPLQLDVTSNGSVKGAVELVQQKYTKLDILINNAGYASIPPDPEKDPEGYRTAFQEAYDVNVTSVAVCTSLFLPLLTQSPDARVINISSGRASMQVLMSGTMPPAVSVPYSVSKVALNALTAEMSRLEENRSVMFLLVNPGHCRTAFNGFKGTRDPMEGAVVVVQCVVREREELGGLGTLGFCETKGDSLELVTVPW